MIPRLIKTEDVTHRLDRAMLHEKACQYVEAEFARKGSVDVLWMIGIRQQVIWLETAWENPDEKAFMLDVIRNALHTTGAHCYAQVSEAWMFNAALVPSAKRDYWIKVGTDEGLRNVPDKYKDDIVWITSFDKSEAYDMSQYKVTIRSRGRGLSFLGPRVDKPMEEASQFAGRMWNLLLPPKPITEEMKKYGKKFNG